ncbi:MAG: radical SAM protein [Candidatus Asgardarchaeia archaeon]
MGTCQICGRSSPLISSYLNLCKKCILEGDRELVEEIVRRTHRMARLYYNLPSEPPKDKNGVKCEVCFHKCVIGEGERGYCGLRYNEDGKIKSMVNANKALCYVYLDPHVTNCCASWFCPGGTGAGYPKYSLKKGGEYGYYNLAVFFYGCNFNCLFCQNYEHKNLKEGRIVSSKEFIGVLERNDRISCICFFGGTPEPQLNFAINVSKNIVEKMEGRIVRICFEWNGTGNKYMVKKAGELSLVSGGVIKFDLKAFNPLINFALCGFSNEAVLKNFEMLARDFFERRREVPLITATTLLVPGYVDDEEVREIAKFIASIDENIPYSILIFHPDYMMRDLPITPKEQVLKCYKEAKKYLKHVNIGNKFLLNL